MTLIAGAGTSEAVWRRFLDESGLPAWDVTAWAGARVTVLAAHPDDEVLGVGGVMVALDAVGAELTVCWATDGEASHPGSTALSPQRLRERRRAEAEEALRRLGIAPVQVCRLGLADSGLASDVETLTRGVGDVTRRADLVLAPWARDGHPDHEAVGAAALSSGRPVAAYPIWMWHWADPAHPAVPWAAAASMPVPDPAAKAAAIDAFRTQVRPIGPDPADAAVLPPHVVARFTRPVEILFT